MEGSAAEKRVLPLRLPELGNEGHPGAGFVRRAVTWTLGILAALVVLALLVSSTVSMDVTVKAAGVMEPVRLYPVRAQETGAIREVLVETGDTVRAGEVVIRLDPLQLETELARLEAQHRAAGIDRQRSVTATPIDAREQRDRLAQAQSRLANARATLLQRMVEHDVGTNVDSLLAAHRGGHIALDQAVSDVRSAEAEIRLIRTQEDRLTLSRFDRERTGTELDQLAAQIRATRERLQRLDITSPATGVVLTERIERLPGSFVQGGAMLLEVANLQDWRVTLAVPEREVHKLSVGDSA
ncbi:MAG TPA: efflux RND transporter periplasmic adaptor subunit, partial [Longimicrobiaceae bacterium]|nr:efflux RND transporter periplasmic adaptor subunit [Longimicrobiaceae bacterium]